MNLVQKILKYYRYDPKTGFPLRMFTGYGKLAGDVGGFIEKGGYRTLTIEGARYKWHRLVWLLHTGALPSGMLDHINGNKDDNRIGNLRPATAAQNVHNRIRSGQLPTGVSKGIKGRYLARIEHGGQRVYLGYYDTPEEAAAAYSGASIVLCGEFAVKLSRAA